MPRRFGTEISNNIRRRPNLTPEQRGKIIGAREAGSTYAEIIPCTGNTSSPDFPLGNALILAPTSRYELGAPCPKFSGLPVVPATFFPFSKLFVYTSMH